MTLTEIGEIRRDSTYEYDIELSENTVSHLISEVLKRTKEYGVIRIDGKAYEYEYGRIIDCVKDNYNKAIKLVRGNGGYSLMNYYVETE